MVGYVPFKSIVSLFSQALLLVHLSAARIAMRKLPSPKQWPISSIFVALWVCACICAVWVNVCVVGFCTRVHVCGGGECAAASVAVACAGDCPAGSLCDLGVGECVVDVASAFSVINFRHYLLDGVTVFSDLDVTAVRSRAIVSF